MPYSIEDLLLAVTSMIALLTLQLILEDQNLKI